jgi:ankyrin repeat protein
MGIIEPGAALDAVDHFSLTALHYAAEKGQTETVRMLLDAGCQWNCATSDGRTPIHNGHDEILHVFADLEGFAASPE